MPPKKILVHIPGKEPFLAVRKRKGTAARINGSSLPDALAERAHAVMQGRVERTSTGQFTTGVMRA